MKAFISSVVLLGLVTGIIVLYVTRPVAVYPSSIPTHSPDVENGKLLFTAGGCMSCHKPAKDNVAADKSLPSGGAPLITPIGTFYPPNLTPDEMTGIGGWQEWNFVSAMKRGVSPNKQHYIPAFPYGSYAAMRVEDVLDVFGYLKTLKPVRSENREPDIPLTWVVRLGIGVWKLMALNDQALEPDPAQSANWNRGAYLVNSAGHCGECHTPRNFMMVPDKAATLAGGPHPEGGKSKVPSLRGLLERKRFKDAKDLATALQWGEAFGYEDMSSGGMGDVQENLSNLPAGDLEAIAEYLISLK